MKPVNLNKKNINGGIHFLQIVLFIGIAFLQRLTNLRPMLMRHLYTRKIQYTEAYFSEGLLQIQTLFLALLFIGSLGYVLRNWRKSTGFMRWEGLLLSVSIMLPVLFIHLPFFKDMITYPYWVFAGYLVLLFQALIRLLLLQIRR